MPCQARLFPTDSELLEFAFASEQCGGFREAG